MFGNLLKKSAFENKQKRTKLNTSNSWFYCFGWKLFNLWL